MNVDTFDTVVMAVLAVMVAAAGYAAFRAAREELGFYRFIRQHGFHRSVASTMWLARVIEHAAALRVSGEWDGLPVAVNRHRRGFRLGMTVVVTADADLVPASAGRVTIGPWTTPAPPALVATAGVVVGRELRLHVSDTPDPAPYVAAAVAYARTLARQPLGSTATDPTGGCPADDPRPPGP